MVEIGRRAELPVHASHFKSSGRDSWGLVRASNTTPCLVLRFEGDDEAALETVKEQFRTLLTGIDATLDLPF